MYSSQIFKQMHKIYQRLGIPDYLVIHDYTACGVVYSRCIDHSITIVTLKENKGTLIENKGALNRCIGIGMGGGGLQFFLQS